MYIATKQILFQGFIVSKPGFGPAYYKEHQETLSKWLADGSVKAKLDVVEGIDNAGEFNEVAVAHELDQPAVVSGY